jgi:hypothetical protein
LAIDPQSLVQFADTTIAVDNIGNKENHLSYRKMEFPFAGLGHENLPEAASETVGREVARRCRGLSFRGGKQWLGKWNGRA